MIIKKKYKVYKAGGGKIKIPYPGRYVKIYHPLTQQTIERMSRADGSIPLPIKWIGTEVIVEINEGGQ